LHTFYSCLYSRQNVANGTINDFYCLLLRFLRKKNMKAFINTTVYVAGSDIGHVYGNNSVTLEKYVRQFLKASISDWP